MPIVNLNKHGGVFKGVPVYTYTGRSQLVDEGNGNWHLQFLSSGYLTFTKVNGANKAESFLVGPGANGTQGWPRTQGSFGKGGDGGRGGELKTVRGIRFLPNKQYRIDIGAPGNPTQIVVDGVVLNVGGVRAIANSGAGKAGGIGSEGAGQAQAGANGEYPFGDSSYGRRYGPSGGGGATDLGTSAPGGADGGAHGGRGQQDYDQTDATPNSGGGGGGAGQDYYASGTPSAGATGTAFIRNAR